MLIENELFRILPIYTMAENMKIKDYNVKSTEDLINEIGFEFINEVITLPRKTNYVLVGTIENIENALSEDNILDVEEFLDDEGIKIETLDDFQLLAECAKIMTPCKTKRLVFQMADGEVILFVEKKHYIREDGFYGIPVNLKIKKKKKCIKKVDKINDKIVMDALEKTIHRIKK